jgi:hypothetical protein
VRPETVRLQSVHSAFKTMLKKQQGAHVSVKKVTAVTWRKAPPRLEQETFRLLAERSNQLSYRTRCWLLADV